MDEIYNRTSVDQLKAHWVPLLNGEYLTGGSHYNDLVRNASRRRVHLLPELKRSGLQLSPKDSALTKYIVLTLSKTD